LKLYNTFEEVQENIKEAIELYLEVLQERGETIPEPTTKVGGWSGCRRVLADYPKTAGVSLTKNKGGTIICRMG